MPIDIYIDNNVWNLLFDKNIDLSVELPREDFCLYLTREAEFEIPPIPEKRKALREFIEKTIIRNGIQVRSYFEFYDDKHDSSEQRIAGFDVGYLASSEEFEFMAQQKSKLGNIKKPKTKLYNNEADISIAARSFHSVVLTLDRKNGPIKDAYKQGGKVIFLNEFDESRLALKDFIISKLDSK